MQTQKANNQSPFLITCNTCGHIDVCAIFMGIAPLLSQKWTDDTRPFEPGQIAAICRKYFSKSVIDSLKEEAERQT